MHILVTGATGTVGGQVATVLATSEHRITALVRDPSRYTAPDGVDVVRGDLTDADDVRGALTGVDRAFLTMADDDGSVFASVAGETGLRHAVLLSSFAAHLPLVLGEGNIVAARHRAGESALTEAGVPATFLRAAGFDYNVLMWTGAIRNSVVRAPFLDVPLPVIDPADIAACAAAVLLAEVPPTGPFSITGPQALSVRDQTAVLAQVLGRDLTLEQIPVAAAKAAAFPAGTPDVVVDSVFGTFSEEAAALPVSGGVELLTGSAPRTFQQWATRHVEAFG